MFLYTPYLALTGAFSSAVVVIVGLSRLNALPSEMKMLLAYFFFAFIANFLSLVLSLKGINNLWFYHFVTLVEFTVFVVVFSSWLDTPSAKQTLRLLIPLFFVFSIMLKLSIEDLRYFDSFSSSLKGVFLVGSASYVLFSLFKREWERPSEDFRFWVLFAVLIYHTVNVMFGSIINAALSLSHPEVARLYSVYWFFGIVANGLYVVAFFIPRSPLQQRRAVSDRSSRI